MDLLSEVLRELHLESTVFCVFELRAPWGLGKESLAGAPFHLVVEGRGQLDLEGWPTQELHAGDLVVLPHGDTHSLGSDRRAPRTPFRRVLAQHGVTTLWEPGTRLGSLAEIRHGGQGAVTRLISGVFAFRDRRRNPVLDALPRLLRVPGQGGRGAPWVESAVRWLLDEASSQGPGSQVMLDRVADLMFVQAVRAYLATTDQAGGWLRGLGEPTLARAMVAVHRRPEAPWTVASLAREAGLSRTVFAERFQRTLGETVMGYVTSWRMHLAAGRLVHTQTSMAEVASAVGYASEVTFSKAFRSWAGVPPGRYRRQQLTAWGQHKARE